jgi:hypothetical protein
MQSLTARLEAYCLPAVCQNFDLENTNNLCSRGISFVPSTTDNCGVLLVTQVSGPALNGSQVAVGTSTATFVVRDVHNNSNQCVANVRVRDTQAPSINCSGNLTRATDSGKCSATLGSYPQPTVWDNCPGVLSLRGSSSQGVTFNQGESVENWLALDGAGNTARCAFSISVFDPERPTISCPASVTAPTDLGVCHAVVWHGSVTSGDNCQVSHVLPISPYVNGSVFPVGQQSVAYFVNDTSSLSANCSLNVTVVDREAPSLGEHCWMR